MSVTHTTFGDTIASCYDDYLVPMIFEEYARDLAARTSVPSGGAVLETAAGTGVLTRHLRSTLPANTTLTATDVNPAMLSVAATRLAEADALSFRVADATDLPFDDESFDAVFCQFGIMFFPDRSQGFREAARVLKPGGSFAFNVWDTLARNQLPATVHETVVTLFPEHPPLFLSIPFGTQDLTLIKDELQEAGFSEIEISVNPGVSRAPSAEAVVMGLVAGSPLRAALEEREALEETMLAVEAALVREFGRGPVAAPMQSISVVAQRPGESWCEPGADRLAGPKS